jgi:site-specific recombinase XerD
LRSRSPLRALRRHKSWIDRSSSARSRQSRDAYVLRAAGKATRFPFLVHSHMLRHSTGYKLANYGHDTRAIQHYLGHRSIVSTVRYTALAPDRFKGFWKD